MGSYFLGIFLEGFGRTQATQAHYYSFTSIYLVGDSMKHDPENTDLKKACVDYCPKCRAEGLQKAIPILEGYQEKAKRLVFEYVRAHLEVTDTHVTFASDEVYIVWFSKTLKNWKALLSTTLPDGMYYEVTYDGAMARTYIDAYKKFDNVTVEDEVAPATFKG
jgi:thiol-disulfide isomerase/thioredoxin